MSSFVRKVKNKNNEITVRRILADDRKRIRLFFLLSGILFIGMGFYYSGTNVRSNTDSSLNTGDNRNTVSFSQEPVKIDKSFLQSKSTNTSSKPPLRIIIPDLGMDIPVKEAKVKNGYWEVFEDTAGFGLNSSYPQESGNQVIFAHARKGLFLPLKSARIGQKVYITTKDQWYSYEIKEIKDVLPEQVEVIAPTTETILTLYTCTGFSDRKRLIVIAKRI